MQPIHDKVQIGEAAIAATVWGSGTPSVVMLHDGLGSVAQWRTVPALIAERTGRTVLAYDRPGHGESTPVPQGPWPVDWLFTQAELLGDLLEHFGTERSLLVGHSDGGTIALLHALEGGPVGIEGIVAIASHSFVEDIAMDFIAEMRTDPGPVVRGLARHHAAPAALFEAWSGVWTSEALRSFDIRPDLSALEMPVLIVQGDADEYATEAQAITTASAIGANATCNLLPGARHLLHHTDPDLVADLVADFVAVVAPS